MPGSHALIPDGFIQDVLSRVDIVEVVGRHVTLRKGGANLLGLCPFHGEKSPSFTVSPAKQFYHCFGCGAHGDAIRFLMEHAGMGFVDAVRDLAQQVGLKVPEPTIDPAERARMDAEQARHRSLAEILERAADHYRQRLRQSPRAIDYLKRRGLSGEIARQFGLGYAPDGWRNLASAFADYADPALVESGLVIVQGDDPADQRRYDRFRDRIMFPIRSPRGEVIGFGARVIDQGEPKYLNSPETPLFVKGRELYGLFEGRSAIRERGHALVVEGYMDVVALAQSGLGHAVATLGTACTADHVQKLLRFTDHIVFSFDGDAAGRRAAGRALEAALPHVNDLRSFRFLFLPPEHDPDSFVRERGQAAFEEAVAQARPLSRMLIDQASDGADLSLAEGRARLLAQARPLWSAMPPGALRTQILGELAETARLAPEELGRLWGLQPSGSGSPRRSGAPRPPADRPPRPAPPRLAVLGPDDQTVRLLLLHAALWEQLSTPDHELLTALPGWHGELFRWLDRQIHDAGPSEWPVLREQLAAESFGSAALALMQGAEPWEVATLESLRAMVERVRQQPSQRTAREILDALARRRPSGGKPPAAG